MVLFDLDHFKTINDTYGHQYGDQILKEIGTIIRDNFRSSDWVGRLGGDEFLVIVDDATHQITEQVRLQVEEQIPVHVSLSAGLSTRLPTDQNPSQIFERADQNLYRAKTHGRNQTTPNTY